MQVLVERRYIFRRRSQKGKLLIAAAASLVALCLMTLQVAEAKPGGYHRVISIEEPAT